MNRDHNAKVTAQKSTTSLILVIKINYYVPKEGA